jgi:hypothetical protein
MGTIKAVDCKVYVRTGGSWTTTPTYTELSAVMNASIEIEHSTFDATTRGGAGFRQTGVSITGLRFPMTLKKDKDDTAFAALETAHQGKTLVELLVLDGTRLLDASKGYRAECVCESWNETQDLEGMVTVDCVFVPGPSSNAPTYASGDTP